MNQINYIGGGICATADCGAGGTLEQFDQTLQSYSVLGTDPSDGLQVSGLIVNPTVMTAGIQKQVVGQTIAALPTKVCGGGIFGYYGKGITAFGAKGFSGVIGEYDTRSGFMLGKLSEAGLGGLEEESSTERRENPG